MPAQAPGHTHTHTGLTGNGPHAMRSYDFGLYVTDVPWPECACLCVCVYRQVKPEARARGSRLSFCIIYPDRFGRNVLRPVRAISLCTLHTHSTLHTCPLPLAFFAMGQSTLYMP